MLKSYKQTRNTGKKKLIKVTEFKCIQQFLHVFELCYINTISFCIGSCCIGLQIRSVIVPVSASILMRFHDVIGLH